MISEWMVHISFLIGNDKLKFWEFKRVHHLTCHGILKELARNGVHHAARTKHELELNAIGHRCPCQPSFPGEVRPGQYQIRHRLHPMAVLPHCCLQPELKPALTGERLEYLAFISYILVSHIPRLEAGGLNSYMRSSNCQIGHSVSPF